ncbi:MAG: helix-turn-helix domain-containing protein [Actinobacteria bacterium]|nr:helix-turn-helix domain-containing protein [Actinomycetota bacterium]
MESSDRTTPIGGGRPTRAERDKSTAATVLAHPLRVRILEVLNERDMSPVEFCREGLAPADLEVAHVAYHFRELAKYGSLAVVEERVRRGSVEHVYRGLGRAFFNDREWNELDREERVKVSKTMVQGLVARIEGALLSDTFDSRETRHLTWIAMRLDEQGWSEMTTALAATFGEIEQIRSDAEARLDRDGDDGIASTCGILGFPSPVDSFRAPPPSD